MDGIPGAGALADDASDLPGGCVDRAVVVRVKAYTTDGKVVKRLTRSGLRS